MTDIPKYYWDACIWITLISERRSSLGQACEYLLDEANAGKCQIWVSDLCLVEVYKRSGHKNPGHPDNRDGNFDDLIEQNFVRKVALNTDIALTARRLIREFPTLRKPADAVHVATSLHSNVDQLHTYDKRNLLGLDRQLKRKDGKSLRICEPPEPTEPALFRLPSTGVARIPDER